MGKTREVRIYNPGAFKYAPRYLVFHTNGDGYLQQRMISWTYERVRIAWVEVVENRTICNKGGQLRQIGRSVAGAILGGTIGMILASAGNHTEWDVDLNIHLKDGRTVETRVKEEEVIRMLHPFMTVITKREELAYKQDLAEDKAYQKLLKEQAREKEKTEKKALKERMARNANTLGGLKRLGYSQQEAINQMDKTGGWDKDPSTAITNILQWRD